MKKYKRNGIVWGKVILEEVQKQQRCGERVKAKHNFFYFGFIFVAYLYIYLFPFNLTLMWFNWAA
jgi:hypothetical protein